MRPAQLFKSWYKSTPNDCVYYILRNENFPNSAEFSKKAPFISCSVTTVSARSYIQNYILSVVPYCAVLLQCARRSLLTKAFGFFCVCVCVLRCVQEYKLAADGRSCLLLADNCEGPKCPKQDSRFNDTLFNEMLHGYNNKTQEVNLGQVFQMTFR